MAEAKEGKAESKGVASISTEGRRLIGQAIIDGILEPEAALLIPRQMDYKQTGGNYEQWTGNYAQMGGGNYTQHADGYGYGAYAMAPH